MMTVSPNAKLVSGSMTKAQDVGKPEQVLVTVKPGCSIPLIMAWVAFTAIWSVARSRSSPPVPGASSVMAIFVSGWAMLLGKGFVGIMTGEIEDVGVAVAVLEGV